MMTSSFEQMIVFIYSVLEHMKINKEWLYDTYESKAAYESYNES